MPDSQPTQGDAVVIKKFFMEGTSSAEALKELKALTKEDKEQLAGGIRNGSLTY